MTAACPALGARAAPPNSSCSCRVRVSLSACTTAPLGADVSSQVPLLSVADLWVWSLHVVRDGKTFQNHVPGKHPRPGASCPWLPRGAQYQGDDSSALGFRASAPISVSQEGPTANAVRQ